MKKKKKRSVVYTAYARITNSLLINRILFWYTVFQNKKTFQSTECLNVVGCCTNVCTGANCCILRIKIRFLNWNPTYGIQVGRTFFFIIATAFVCQYVPKCRSLCAPDTHLCAEGLFCDFREWHDESSSRRIILYLPVCAVYSVPQPAESGFSLHLGVRFFGYMDVNWRCISLGAVWQFFTSLLWNSRKLFQNKLFLTVC